jgi:hypothetical protein
VAVTSRVEARRRGPMASQRRLTLPGSGHSKGVPGLAATGSRCKGARVLSVGVAGHSTSAWAAGTSRVEGMRAARAEMMERNAIAEARSCSESRGGLRRYYGSGGGKRGWVCVGDRSFAYCVWKLMALWRGSVAQMSRARSRRHALWEEAGRGEGGRSSRERSVVVVRSSGVWRRP